MGLFVCMFGRRAEGTGFAHIVVVVNEIVSKTQVSLKNEEVFLMISDNVRILGTSGM